MIKIATNLNKLDAAKFTFKNTYKFIYKSAHSHLHLTQAVERDSGFNFCLAILILGTLFPWVKVMKILNKEKVRPGSRGSRGHRR